MVWMEKQEKICFDAKIGKITLVVVIRVVVILIKNDVSGEGENERFAEKYYKKLNERFLLCFQIIQYYCCKKFLSCIECPDRAEKFLCIDMFITSIHCNSQAGRAMQR